MKKLGIAVAGMALVAVAASAALPPIPASATPSSESSIVRTLPQTCRSLRRFELNASFWGGLTNSFQVALGRDADGDGDLAPEETGAIYGWDCGRPFVEDVASGGRFLGEGHASETSHVLNVAIVPGDAAGPHRSAAVRLDGVPVFTNVSRARPAWLLDEGWDTVKATWRGAMSPSASVDIDRQFTQGLRIVVR